MIKTGEEMRENRPRLLDLFCGAGGAAMGYYRAGFDCYGIDNDPKLLRHYPYPHICMDALEVMDRLLRGEGLTFSNGETLYMVDFAAFHASPPCQGYSTTRNCSELFGFQEHPLYLGDVRMWSPLGGKRIIPQERQA